MSRVVSGVASIWSKSLLNFSLKKKLNVESSTEPFIAEAASMPGATNSAYGISWPPTSKPPTRAPTPMPMLRR
jgi:hypothetical protein